MGLAIVSELSIALVDVLGFVMWAFVGVWSVSVSVSVRVRVSEFAMALVTGRVSGEGGLPEERWPEA
jgi:hypothetical protein